MDEGELERDEGKRCNSPGRSGPLEANCPWKGLASLTRTDLREGKWGNCSSKSSVCSSPGFLLSARGAGCRELLCSCSALTPSLRTARAALTPFRWVHGGKGAFSRAETSDLAPLSFSSFLPEQGMQTHVHCPIPKTILLPSPLNSNFCHHPWVYMHYL